MKKLYRVALINEDESFDDDLFVVAEQLQHAENEEAIRNLKTMTCFDHFTKAKKYLLAEVRRDISKLKECVRMISKYTKSNFK